MFTPSHDSHPKTYNLLKKLSKRSHVDLVSLKTDSTLIDLCIRIYIYILPNNKKKIKFEVSNTFDDNTNNPKRLYKCCYFWLPYCIEIADTISKSFFIELNASDWGIDDCLSMTSKNINNIIPDEYSMYESDNLKRYKLPKNINEFKSYWISRKPIMFWRGSTTGKPIYSTQSLKELIRVKTCLIYQGDEAFDIKISNIVQNKIPKQIISQWLCKNNIYSNRVNESKFMEYKYHPDLAGNNELCGSWGVIRKYLRGNLVFRPSYKSYMYYDQFLEPWKNYIPVELDFSDLREKYLWAENNQEEAIRISWEGFCMATNYLHNIKAYFINTVIQNIITFDLEDDYLYSSIN